MDLIDQVCNIVFCMLYSLIGKKNYNGILKN